MGGEIFGIGLGRDGELEERKESRADEGSGEMEEES